MAHLNFFPIYLSFKVALLATVFSLVLGLPAAYYLSRSKGKLADFTDALLTLPIVLPPTVLGYYLLIFLGRQSAVGRFLEQHFGITVVFTQTGAVIAALAVSIPFFIQSARTAFAGIDEDLLHAARVLGRSEWNLFFSVVIPLSWRGLTSGMMLVFARALGDFGATLMVAGSIPNQTETMSIAIYDALMNGDTRTADLLVIIMTVLSVAILYGIKRLEKRVIRGEDRHAARKD
ncbi:molybdenum ABC transporter permease subunit [Weizmannia acidilactici]|uniref:Molybdenum transport system permease n=1 Tax=Weizmannia acidilactici TaxID=2607726 RepID=A0A5J4JDN8_9BACI|nr:molybdate ABC transporter permease subunit [Weizmannia acidilactici]GER66435.1 molybdenum ABC transporter permease subunit [Weizmannia acidilactici]GER69419.1 molybdenum ABC transporter permease subunit [Weizmannia acidilactici]GER72253.1 molybdenum ABC transporter permease subunit [Weizmannia acidilactici]